MVPWASDDDDLSNWTIIGKAKIAPTEHPGGLIVSKDGIIKVVYWDKDGVVKLLPLGAIEL